MTSDEKQMIHCEHNFVFSDKNTLAEDILKSAFSNVAELPLRPPIDEERQKLKDALIQTIHAASKLQKPTGELSALVDDVNIAVPKACWTIIKTGIKLLPFFISQGASQFPYAQMAEALTDLYSSIEKLSPDDRIIIEAIQSLTFEKASLIIKEPGPTLEALQDKLIDQEEIVAELPKRLSAMVEAGILRHLYKEEPKYYQVKYLSQYLPYLAD